VLLDIDKLIAGQLPNTSDSIAEVA
jgi:hypothetical protein